MCCRFADFPLFHHVYHSSKKITRCPYQKRTACILPCTREAASFCGRGAAKPPLAHLFGLLSVLAGLPLLHSAAALAKYSAALCLVAAHSAAGYVDGCARFPVPTSQFAKSKLERAGKTYSSIHLPFSPPAASFITVKDISSLC